MRQYIKETLMEMYKDVTTDKYGQVSIFNFRPSLFGDKEEEVIEYCSKHKGILQFSTYGNRYMTYTAFTIEDAEIRRCCKEVLKNNPNYIRNMNNWY